MHSKKEIFRLMVASLKQIIPHAENRPLQYQSQVSYLGAFSVSSEMIEAMIKEFDLNADRFEFHKAGTLGELADMFLKKVNQEDKSIKSNITDTRYYLPSAGKKTN